MVTVTTGLLADFTLLGCPFECAVHKALAVPFFFFLTTSVTTFHINERIV